MSFDLIMNSTPELIIVQYLEIVLNSFSILSIDISNDWLAFISFIFLTFYPCGEINKFLYFLSIYISLSVFIFWSKISSFLLFLFKDYWSLLSKIEISGLLISCKEFSIDNFFLIFLNLFSIALSKIFFNSTYSGSESRSITI